MNKMTIYCTQYSAILRTSARGKQRKQPFQRWDCPESTGNKNQDSFPKRQSSERNDRFGGPRHERLPYRVLCLSNSDHFLGSED